MVVGIILLLMGLAILSPRLIRTTRPELEAASLLYGTLMETRSQALRDGAYYRISISNNITIQRYEETTGWDTVKTIPLPSGVSYCTVIPGTLPAGILNPPIIHISITGSIVRNTGLIPLCGPKQKYSAIELYTSGQATIYRWTGSGWKKTLGE